ncbi:hypothetical protein BJ742DRAFT_885486 [Cladochytrium replicatum]|nr:hypothetical protein BJ742DRAFT_885486 [Cladochytrium replicatum]
MLFFRFKQFPLALVRCLPAANPLFTRRLESSASVGVSGGVDESLIDMTIRLARGDNERAVKEKERAEKEKARADKEMERGEKEKERTLRKLDMSEVKCAQLLFAAGQLTVRRVIETLEKRLLSMADQEKINRVDVWTKIFTTHSELKSAPSACNFKSAKDAAADIAETYRQTFTDIHTFWADTRTSVVRRVRVGSGFQWRPAPNPLGRVVFVWGPAGSLTGTKGIPGPEVVETRTRP